MKAVVYRGRNDLRLETVPVPRIGSPEILVKVAVCGVCPTDIKKIHYGTVPPPRIFGHETSGTIVRVGARVQKWRIGDRVALHHHVPCMKCHACRHKSFAQCPQYKKTGITAGFEPAGGGYAEYVRVMPFVLPGLVRIPKKNSFIEGSLVEPVNTVLKGIKKLALAPGDTAWVIGQGPIGLIFTRLLSLQGIRVFVTDLIESRLGMAREFGAKWAMLANSADLAEKANQATRGAGFDAAIVCVPSDEAASVGLDLVRGAGKVLLFAHTTRGAMARIDLSKTCVDEKELIGSYSSDITIQHEVASWVFSGVLNVSKFVTHQLPLEDTVKAVQLASEARQESLKVVVVQ